MGLLRRFFRGLHALTHGDAVDRDVDDEVRHYVEQAAAAHVARGANAQDAMRLARLELGSTTAVRQQVRDSGWESGLAAALTDARYALRRLRYSPGFSAVTVLTLAVGVGATTAIFSAVNAILLEPLPYPHAQGIVSVWELGESGRSNQSTFGMYRGLLDRNAVFSDLAAMKSWQPSFTGAQQAERLDGQRVSSSFFRVLGIAPALGRDFADADDVTRGPNHVIISDGLWRRRFGADASVIGRLVRLEDSAFTVVGVLPPTFENVLAPTAEVYAPLQYELSEGRAWGHHLHVIGRLKNTTGIELASREVNAMGRAVIEQWHPETYGAATQFSVMTLQDELTQGVRRALLLILAAAALVLVIACINVTNLLLARGVLRRGEFALRAALGAGRRRLVRQLLTESVVLGAIGGALGIALALLGSRVIVAMSPPELPRVAAIGVDGRVLVFTLLLTTVIALVVGVMPAVQAASDAPHGDLQQTSRRAIGLRSGVRNALVVAEVALALILLVNSGLLLRSIERLFAVPVGFDPSSVLTVQVQVSGQRFESDSAKHQFFSQATSAIQAIPGVEAVAFTSQLPLSGDQDEYGASFDATPTQAAVSFPVFRYTVSPGYLETMRIPLRAGRLLNDGDRRGATPVALISESLARLRFGSESPLGQQVHVGGFPSAPAYTIVGVVGDVKQVSLALNQSAAVYLTTTQWHWVDNVMSFVVRTRGDAGASTPAVRAAIWSIDRDQPVVRVATMEHLLSASAAERQFALLLFEGFSLAALLLAAAGIYGLLSGNVAERTREIGVRSALGATKTQLLLMIVRHSLRLTCTGMVIGLIGALLTTRVTVAMLFGVSPLDPLTYVGVVFLLILVALAASAVPVARALGVDPTTTLRAD